MKKYLVIIALILSAIAIGAYFFVFDKKDICKNVIPQDAKAVLVIDAKQALKQLDFSISDIFKALKHQEADEKKDWGIDMLSPVYGFVSADNYMCTVFALSDAEDFEERIKGENIPVESQRGFKWVNKGEFLLCFDGDKALAIGPVTKTESDGMRGKMVEWMKQGSHKIPVLSSLKSNNDVIALRSTLGVLPSTFTKQITDNLADVSLDDIFLNATLNVKDKSFLLSTEVESQDKKFSKFSSEIDNFLRPIDGEMLPACMDAPLFRAVVNVDGDRVLSKLRENPIVRMTLIGLSLCIDTDMMIKAIDGDVLLEFAGRSIASPSFVASARVKNQDFLRNAKDWCSGSSALGYICQAFDDKNFVLQNGGSKFFFGVHDDFLYLSSDNRNTLQFSTPGSVNTISQEQVHGKRLYASIDVNKMYEFVNGSRTESDNSPVGLDHLNVSATGFGQFQVELTTKGRAVDAIKQLLK